MKKSKRELELEELTYSLVPTPANLLVLLGKEKASQMQDTSGQTLLGLSKSANRLGLLEKTLVDTLNSVLIPYSRIWKLRVTTQGHLLFQLQRSELGTDENEYGLSDIRNYPTPTVGCEEGGEQSDRVELTPNGSFILRKKNKPENTFGAKLSDAMLFLEKQKMFPTPCARDWKDTKLYSSQDKRNSDSLPIVMMKKERQKMYRTPTVDDSKVVNPKDNRRAGLVKQVNIEQNRKTGGKLNPNFVEFLMGFPMDWTKVESEESKD